MRVLSFLLAVSILFPQSAPAARAARGPVGRAPQAPLSRPVAPRVLPALAPALPSAPSLPPALSVPRLEKTGEAVAAAVEKAGSIQQASGEQASALGGELQKALEDGSGAAPPSDGVPGDGGDGGGGDFLQALRLRTLKFVASIFIEHYAPKEWKAAARGVDFRARYDAARAAVIADPAMSQRAFQRILADFVAAAQDYHAGITFYSTEASRLPLTILGADGSYFIADVDRKALPASQFPFEPGDEIVEFAGRPAAEAVAALMPASPNTAETDARLAQMQLTGRAGRRAQEVPQGPVTLRIRTADGKLHDATLQWDYRPELIPADVPPQGEVLGPELVPDPAADLGLAPNAPPPTQAALLENIRGGLKRFLRLMAHPDAPAMLEEAAQPQANGFSVGAKRSFVPRLGKVVWELPAPIAAQIPFDAYIYENAEGKKIGYIRIPDYMGGGDVEQAAGIFAKLVAMFEKETEGLVIDQVNNPGGNMFYMYALLSLLTNKPLSVPPHRMLIDESDARMAAEIIRRAESPGVADMLRKALAERMMGLVPGAAQEHPVVRFARFLIDQLKSGKRLTDPVHLFGVDSIDPHPQVRYTKPIVVLINELDFSAGDFFPAILQQNKRATLFGVRTAGAGGAVKPLQWPNQLGIEMLAYTWTIALRAAGLPIENLGVDPDVAYQITAQDLRDGFKPYARAVNDAVSRLIGSPNP